MDGGDVEPGNRLYEDKRGLQELLRRAAFNATAIDGKRALSKRVSVNAAQRRRRSAKIMEERARDFRKFNERSFPPGCPLEFIQQVFQTMRDCPQHTFQILTKRSDRLRQLAAQIDWPANVWMGVSVEDAKVLSRVDDLRVVPAAVRFLSCEPLIGSLAGIDLRNIQWVIVGGESGPHSRTMSIQWVREIFRECRNQKVPFFFKQWGGVRKDLTGRLLGGRTYGEMPERVAA